METKMMKKGFIALQWFKCLLRKILPSSVVIFLVKIIARVSPPQFENSFVSLSDTQIEDLPQRDLIRSKESRTYSQNGEDGLIDFLFSRIEAPSKRFVEIGIEDGTECNTRLLSCAKGWTGLVIEGSDSLARSAKKRYAKEAPGRVKVIQAFASPRNINELLTNHSFAGEIDLLSIDIDSYDYWLWEAINCIRPRLVVIEYNGDFGPVLSLTVPYEENFDRFKKHFSGYYSGASLTAMNKLGERKGYGLVASDSRGVNAFFVRKDLLASSGLETLSPEAAYYTDSRRRWKETPTEVLSRLRHLEFYTI